MAADFAARIAAACLNQYRRLSKKGKPVVGEEWTPLAAVVLVEGKGQGKDGGVGQPLMKVVALGTGSKCIGHQRMCRRGLVVNDSHAEVLARRAFCCYLQGQIGECLRGREDSVMEQGDLEGRARLKARYTFHFFATQPPCGDACIFTMETEGERARSSGRGEWEGPHFSPEHPRQDTVEDGVTRDNTPQCLLPQHRAAQVASVPSGTRDNDSDSDSDSEASGVPRAKRLKCSPPPSPPPPGDIHRTGARCAVKGEQDPHLPGVGYHTVGLLRTKPGRGDPTHSMSCSDKMLRWNVLGCQGGLLTSLLECPVYFDSFTFLDTLYDESAVRRALWERRSSIAEVLTSDVELKRRGYKLNKPDLHVVKASEVLTRDELLCFVQTESLKPAPGGVCWCVEPRCHDVVVQGVKQGTNSRQEPSKTSGAFVCKARRLDDLKGMLSSLPDNCLPRCLRDRPLHSYREWKRLDKEYCRARALFLQFCPSWMENTEDFESFK